MISAKLYFVSLEKKIAGLVLTYEERKRYLLGIKSHLSRDFVQVSLKNRAIISGGMSSSLSISCPLGWKKSSSARGIEVMRGREGLLRRKSRQVGARAKCSNYV